MDINRNQFFLAGLVLLFLGIQFRMVESAVLTPAFTRLLADTSGSSAVAAANSMSSIVGSTASVPPMTFRPPEWLGYSLLSAGAVLILHAMAMRRPDG